VKGGRRKVDVDICVDDRKVFSGIFDCHVLDRHVLDRRDDVDIK
jgi:hypothetical protein